MYQPYPGSDTQLPELHRPPAPPSVLNAVKVMYVGGLTAPVAGPVKIWAGLVWLVALTAVVFLWRRSSTAYFKGTPS